jgi:hypothetical protein
MVIPTAQDIEALWNYIDGPAQEFSGMTYADGLRDMVEWLSGDADRPDEEE